MSPGERRKMVSKDVDLSLSRQCKVLNISRSGLYYTPVGMCGQALALMHQIDRVFTRFPFFGNRQIAAYLPRAGYRAGRHRVRRLMKIMGLEAIYKRPNTSKNIPKTGYIPLCCAVCRSIRPTKSGALTSPISRSGMAFCIWLRLWTEQRERCCPSGCPTLWAPAFALRPCKRLSTGSACHRS